jgi:four helix bundle protein
MEMAVTSDSVFRFEDLAAWKKGRELTRGVYAISTKSGLAEEFDLRRQMRRSAVSITSNIAEGFERSGNRELYRFLSIAKGSCGELRSQVIIASDQGFITEKQFHFLHDRSLELSKIIAGLMRGVKKKIKEESKKKKAGFRNR